MRSGVKCALHFRLGAVASSGYNVAWSLALVGAGHLVGLSVGMAMPTGLVIAWVIAVPLLTSAQPAAAGVDLAAHTTAIWRTQVRFIGAGAMAVAAVYTLTRLAKPVVGGLAGTRAKSGSQAGEDDRDSDLSPAWILALTVASLAVAGWLAYTFPRSSVLAPSALKLTPIDVPFVLVVVFLIAGICGYTAGLIGASNSPISGVGILSVVLCASTLTLAVAATPGTSPALVALALFVTAIIFASRAGPQVEPSWLSGRGGRRSRARREGAFDYPAVFSATVKDGQSPAGCPRVVA